MKCGNNLVSKPKIIITGASGWLGTSAIEFLINSNIYRHIELILLTSNGRNIWIQNRCFQTHKYNDYKVDISENVIGIVHLAFLTKGRVNEITNKVYILQNREITQTVVRLIKTANPSWVTTVSSGAAAKFNSSIEDDPYGFLKLEEEFAIKTVCAELGIGFSIGRLWGAMGFDMPINRKYAISDFICQALGSKQINIEASKMTYRYYCDSRNFMEMCITLAELKYNKIFDSGGFKVEIGVLAELVSAKTGSKIMPRTISTFRELDQYCPIDNSYLELQNSLKIRREIGLDALIGETIEGHKLQYRHLV